ncbi:MAG: pitrilysin family protein [Candidatus Paceibacterota bacterium]
MQYNKTILPNGLRLITIPMKESPTVTMLVMVEAGSKYEIKDKSGISHFLEHMCFKGTDKRPRSIDISRELDGIGAHYNAFTGEEYTGYYAKSHPDYVEKIIDVVSDLYLNPIFRDEEVEREKGVIVEEINMYNDLPQRHVGEKFMTLLYGDQPAGWGIAGTADTVTKMTKEDFAEYRRTHYLSSASTVIVAGNFNEEAIKNKIEGVFAAMPSGEKASKLVVQESQTSPAIVVEKRDIDQVHMIIGVRTFGVNDKRTPVLRVLNAVLGGGMSGRLFQRMREELGICYYVHSSNNPFTDHGFLDISAGVDKNRVQEAVGAIIAEMKKFVIEKVSEAELQKAKDFLVGNMYLGLESSDSIAEWFAHQEIMHRPLRTAEEVTAEIRKVTAEDIQNVAHEIFKDEGLNMAVVGKAEEGEITSLLTFGK